MSENEQGLEGLIQELGSEFMEGDLKPELLAKIAAINCHQAKDKESFITSVSMFESDLLAMDDEKYRNAVAKKRSELEVHGDVFMKENGGGFDQLARFRYDELIRLLDRKKMKDKELKT